LLPIQVPDAIHVLASVLLQLSMAAPPGDIAVGLALRATVGAACGSTVTVVLACALPPAPLQLNTKFDEAFSVPVLTEPLVGSLPLHAPEAVQLVALLLLQLSMALLPPVIAVGVADNETTGCALTWPPPLSPPPPPPQACRNASKRGHARWPRLSIQAIIA
jgi:hypothetical protein